MRNAFFRIAFFLVFLLADYFTITNVSAANNSESDNDIFAVESVEVKQTGQNSLIAKEKALSIAMRKSFNDLLINRFNLESKKLPSFSYKDINNCVYDCSIESEKHSDSIYICEASYRFDGQKVAALLKKYGIKSDLVDKLIGNTQEKKKKYTRIAVYTDDFIRILFDQNLIVEDFSSERVILKIKTDSLESFKNFGIKYAQL